MSNWVPTDADYEWEIERINLDALELDLRLLSPHPRTIRIIIFDTAHYHDWKIGDHVAIYVGFGPKTQLRRIQENMGIPLAEEDYTLFNQRTGGKAISRKNDWNVK